MLMKDERNKSITQIIGKLKKEKPEIEYETAPEKDGVLQDDSVALETAAEELISAIDSKSPKAIAEAFKSMIELCQSETTEVEE